MALTVKGVGMVVEVGVVESAGGLCACGHPAARRFRFAAGSTPVEKCFRHSAVHRPLLRNAIATALVVGTVLTAINQGNVLLDGRFPAELWWKVPLTYSVPFLVSTWAALRISLVREHSGQAP